MRTTPTSRILLVCVMLVLPLHAFGESAVILDLREWEVGYSGRCGDLVRDACWIAKFIWGNFGAEGEEIQELEETDIQSPSVTLEDWRTNVPAANHADLITHGSEGRVLAEYHDSDFERRYAHQYYLGLPQYEDGDIYMGDYWGNQPEYYGIGFTTQGIQTHLSGVGPNPIIAGNYCGSCGGNSSWLGPQSTPGFLCFLGEPEGTDACTELYLAMIALGCQAHPDYGATAEEAARLARTHANLTQCPQGKANRYCWEQDCHNIAAAFDGVFAFDGKVVFRTVHETGSFCFFVMGLDSWGDVNAADWKSWDVLARVRPEGGHGAAHLYEVDGVPDKAVYRIVEVDRYGRPTFSPTFVRGTRPVEYDLWLAHPAIVAAAKERSPAPSGLHRWVSGRTVPYDREFGWPRHEEDAGRLDGGALAGSRADSSWCADIVVYTNADYDSLLPPVWNHLSSYPSRKVMYFTGSSSLDDARTCYTGVYWANVAYNQGSGTQRFPTDSPGPLLLIVGDSGAAPERTIVDHGSFDDSYDRCYLGVCLSDRDATDVTGEGWIGLVHRIPGATVAEVSTACAGADDWNAGDYVDPGRQVIQIVGNELAETAVDWPIDMADRAASEFLGEGYLPKPVLVESDFGEGESKVAAFNAQLETGAAVLWGFGRLTGAAGYSKWPGSFVGSPDSTYHARKQRMIALLPGCSTMHVYIGYSPLSAPRIERWMFNEPDLTQIVGGVGHLVGGWEHQHRKAEELYMAAWIEAPDDAPLDWVVWRAARMADEQGLDWMSEYFRSAATIGGYVLNRPGDESYTWVPEGTDGLPATWSLRQNAPNPFNPSTTLEYSVPGTGGHVRMDIYDASGRHVAGLVDADKAPGVYRVTWDGSNDSGAKVSSGVYFCRMEAPGFTERRKLVTIK
ncbi:MAG: FlgD immunoglobulin-like domain containing protein [Candidatus Eisenbacteria bacterium]